MKKQNKTVSQVPRVIFDLIYSILLKRVTLGYTQDDLDFFLGFGANYWRSIETFYKYQNLNVADILCLADAFNCSADDFAYLVENQCLEDILNIKVISYSIKGHIVRKAFEIIDGKKILLYQILEISPSEYATNHPDELLNAKAAVDGLYRNGYFDSPKDSVEVYRVCNEWANQRIKPRFIEKALRPYLSSEDLKPTGGSRHDTQASSYKPDLDE